MGAGASAAHTISISPSGKVLATDADGAAVILEGVQRHQADIFEKALAMTLSDSCNEELKASVNELRRLALTITLESGDRR